jgi:hypothetical protein
VDTRTKILHPSQAERSIALQLSIGSHLCRAACRGHPWSLDPDQCSGFTINFHCPSQSLPLRHQEKALTQLLTILRTRPSTINNEYGAYHWKRAYILVSCLLSAFMDFGLTPCSHSIAQVCFRSYLVLSGLTNIMLCTVELTVVLNLWYVSNQLSSTSALTCLLFASLMQRCIVRSLFHLIPQTHPLDPRPAPPDRLH